VPYQSVNPATGALRSGHTDADKIEMLKKLWSTFEDLTGIPTDQLALSLQEIPLGQCDGDGTDHASRWSKELTRP
jgi:hypothetical protein